MKLISLFVLLVLSLAASTAAASDISIGIGGIYVGTHGRGHYRHTEVYVDSGPVYVDRREVIIEDRTPVYHDGGYYVDYWQGGHRYTGSYPDNYHYRGGWRYRERYRSDRGRWHERRDRDDWRDHDDWHEGRDDH